MGWHQNRTPMDTRGPLYYFFKDKSNSRPGGSFLLDLGTHRAGGTSLTCCPPPFSLSIQEKCRGIHSGK